VSNALCTRLLRFSMVGALGVVVQLGALAVFIAVKVDYLRATALAVESAVLHNFLWHRRFTWSDRAQPGIRNFFPSLLRFHVSNGLVSLMGNLILMRLLVGNLKIPLLIANLGSIAICFAANFMASDRWVFRPRTNSASRGLVVDCRISTRPLPHEHERALRKRNVSECCRDPKGQP
jgi:putative flippase GtrA